MPSGDGGEGPFGLAFDDVRRGFNHDGEESLALEAFTRLRGQAFTILTEQCPLVKWPDVLARFIVMRNDRAVDPAWSRRVAMTYPRATVIEMDGGHSPFFAQPLALGAVPSAIDKSSLVSELPVLRHGSTVSVSFRVVARTFAPSA